MARPSKYNTVAEMETIIEEYFKSCKGKPLLDDDGEPQFDKKGNLILIGEKPPTVTGLALALGFSSRQSLLNYQGKKGFVDTITRAKARCEEYAETRLFDRDGAHGAQFSLKYNFGWETEKKKTDSDQTVEDDPLTKSLKEEMSHSILK